MFGMPVNKGGERKESEKGKRISIINTCKEMNKRTEGEKRKGRWIKNACKQENRKEER
jgi:hypothetical protein